MSIRVYQAYAVKKNTDIWILLRTIRQTAEERIKTELLELYKSWIDNAAFIEKIKAEYEDVDDQRLPVYLRMYLIKRAKEELIQSQKSFFDLSVSLQIHHLEGKYYIIPYANGVFRNVLSFLNDHPLLTFYGYWDNTDPDPNCNKEEWLERKEVWEIVLDNWKNALFSEIVSLESLYLLDPYMQLTSNKPSSQCLINPSDIFEQLKHEEEFKTMVAGNQFPRLRQYVREYTLDEIDCSHEDALILTEKVIDIAFGQ